MPASDDGHLVGQHEHLLAEATADVAHDDADAMLGQAERPTEEGAHAVRTLRRDPHGEALAHRVPVGHDAAGLHWHAEVAVLREGLGDDVGRRGEDLLEAGIVGRGNDAGHVVDQSGVDDGGVGGHGGVGADDRLGRFDVEVDELARVFGDVPGLGDHQDDRLAGEAHVALGQESEGTGRTTGSLEVDPALADGTVQILAGVHRDHTGQVAGRRSTSIERMVPRAMSLRRKAACSMPGTTMSST